MAETLARHTLVLGGARSGKTRRAMTIAEAATDRVYIATAEAHDAEMRDRIARHQSERRAGWRTVEASLDLPEAIQHANRGGPTRTEVANTSRAIMVDCLTLWLSNLMHAERDVARATAELIVALKDCATPVVLVSNEVGLGIVPENALARAFRDAQGHLNQAIAREVGTVEFVAAGLPLRLKGG